MNTKIYNIFIDVCAVEHAPPTSTTTISTAAATAAEKTVAKK